MSAWFPFKTTPKGANYLNPFSKQEISSFRLLAEPASKVAVGFRTEPLELTLAAASRSFLACGNRVPNGAQHNVLGQCRVPGLRVPKLLLQLCFKGTVGIHIDGWFLVGNPPNKKGFGGSNALNNWFH